MGAPQGDDGTRWRLPRRVSLQGDARDAAHDAAAKRAATAGAAGGGNAKPLGKAPLTVRRGPGSGPGGLGGLGLAGASKASSSFEDGVMLVGRRPEASSVDVLCCLSCAAPCCAAPGLGQAAGFLAARCLLAGVPGVPATPCHSGALGLTRRCAPMATAISLCSARARRLGWRAWATLATRAS
jgi:hypothetical protein